VRPDQTTGATEGVPARLFLVTALLLIAMGVALRLVGYFGGIEFWWDEALWAVRIAEGEAASHRPLGYVWVSRWLIDLRNTEPVIRSVSLFAGVVSLPVFLAMCRQAGLSRLTSLFGLFVLAVHPAAIDLTKEFKPYALELLLHLLLLWLAFSFLRSHEMWRLALMCLAATLAAPFSWSIVVLYPGLFAIVALSVFRRRSIPQLLTTLGGAVTTLGVFLAAYLAQRQGVQPKPGYWGEKYDVFYVGSGLPGFASWLLEKTYDVASFPGRLETFWLGPRAAEVSEVAVATLCATGIIAMFIGRRWDRAALWVSPWILTVGLNLVGRWPYGVFRTNLFLLAYSLPVALAGLDGLRRWIAERRPAARPKARLIAPVFCSSFVLAFLPLDVGFFAEGKGSDMAGNCHMHQAMKVIYEVERDEAAPARRRRFWLDTHARGVYRYYRSFHAVAREEYHDFFQERYRPTRPFQTLKDAISRQAGRGLWLLVCKADHATAARQGALEHCPQVDHLEDFRHGGVLLRCRGDAERLPRQ
jgi:hypothetical protein